MRYLDQELRVLVVYPQVAGAIAAYYEKKGIAVAPPRELRYGLDEVMQVVNLLGAEILTGPQASLHGFLQILSQPYDVLWILTHGVEEGWFLSDGLVNASEMTALVRSSGIFLTVMNSCSSYEVAYEVASELGTAMVCTIAEVPDRQAFITGTLFARHLASGLDYVTAWEKAKPGQEHPYILIEATRPMNQSGRPRPSSEDGTLNKLNNSIDELERIVYGSSRLGLPPLREMTNTLQKELSEIRTTLREVQSTLSQIQSSQRERNRLIYSMITAIVILLVAVSFVIYRGL